MKKQKLKKKKIRGMEFKVHRREAQLEVPEITGAQGTFLAPFSADYAGSGCGEIKDGVGTLQRGKINRTWCCKAWGAFHKSGILKTKRSVQQGGVGRRLGVGLRDKKKNHPGTFYQASWL